MAHVQFERLLSRSENLQDLPDDGEKGLLSSLSRTDKGYPLDRRTPFFDEKPRDEIASLLNETIGVMPFPRLQELENEERNKVGPQSIRLPWSDRYEDAVAYMGQSASPEAQSLMIAFQNVVRLVARHSVRPADFSTAFGLMPKGTSLGLPWMTSKKEFAEYYLDRAQHISRPEDIYPAVVWWRGQANGTDVPKQRIVWMMDHAETICGARYQHPILESLRRIKGFSAWGTPTDVDHAITRILGAPGLKYSSDYSAFDTSPTRQVGHLVFEVFKHWLIPSEADFVDLLEEIFFTVSLVVPWEDMTGRNGGVPSGSVFTNLFDSLMNLLIGFYIADRLHVELKDYEVMGDDSVFVFDSDPNPQDMSDAAAEMGFNMNPEKQYIADDAVHYLQRLHLRDYAVGGINVGMRPLNRSLTSATGYETLHRDWNEMKETARLLMLMENCSNHPLFHEYVEFMYFEANDRVLRGGVDPVAVIRSLPPEDVLRTVGKAAFVFNTADPSEVESWKVVQEVRALQMQN
jgi:hypothetical protein